MEHLNKFFKDPDWKKVEEIINGYIDPLRSIDSIDHTKSAEDVKAQVLAHKTSIKAMESFLDKVGLVHQEEDGKGSFR
jgi:hypothetical protein